jgi:hypothetical protein
VCVCVCVCVFEGTGGGGSWWAGVCRGCWAWGVAMQRMLQQELDRGLDLGDGKGSRKRQQRSTGGVGGLVCVWAGRGGAARSMCFRRKAHGRLTQEGTGREAVNMGPGGGGGNEGKQGKVED